MYKEIQDEFAPQFEKIGLDFKIEYQKAFSRVGHYQDYDVMKGAIKGILSGVLLEYSRTKPKTDMGRIGRIGARILSEILKFIKFKK